MEHTPREPGSEEYLDSEKYELRHWDLDRPDSLREMIALVNRIRRENPALQSDHGLRFHEADNEQILCYSKTTADGTIWSWWSSTWTRSTPRRPGSSSTSRSWGSSPDQQFQVHDLLTDARYLWHGARNFVGSTRSRCPRTSSGCAAGCGRSGTSTTFCEGIFGGRPRDDSADRDDGSTADGGRQGAEAAADDPLWYKDAIIYEIHVRAFFDSDGDGIGDFRGLTAKLDYLQDLGVTALWLLPFYPSPLRDDGYDIADYTSVHPAYGTLEDFQLFLDEAHERGLRVITELVINHTSDQHPWFQRARRAPPGSPERDFYVWSDTDTKYPDARIIFKDFETSNWTWDPVANAYYWHRFFSHQPDLNFDNPQVQEELFRALDFWLEMGVDGLRLDAVPYLYEREGTNCENLPETHAFLQELRAHIDAQVPRPHAARRGQPVAGGRRSPTSAMGGGDECHMAFHFPVMPRLFMALRMEDRFPIIDILQQTPPIPEKCQWAIFLRNHDELTLEMVTDEERDYMYRVYAEDPEQRINLGIRRRLAPLLGNDRRRIELMNGLLFSLPGTPVLYYGDEIGMGDNIYLGDRNGVRTPMQWSADRNAGFSRANPQRLYLPVIIDPEYHYEAVNVEAQQRNPHSLLWWMRRLIALRKRHPAFGRGTIEFLQPENRKVLAFVRRYGGGDAPGGGQPVALLAVRRARPLGVPGPDARSRCSGASPFPRSATACYLLTLGPHGFYWFSLMQDPAQLGRVQRAAPSGSEAGSPVPALASRGRGGAVRGHGARGGSRGRCCRRAAVAPLVRRQGADAARRGRSRRRFRSALGAGAVSGAAGAVLALLRVDYVEAESEVYALPLAFAPDAEPASGWSGSRARRAAGGGAPRVRPPGGLRAALRSVRRSRHRAPAARGGRAGGALPRPEGRAGGQRLAGVRRARAARGTSSPRRSRGSRATPRCASATG